MTIMMTLLAIICWAATGLVIAFRLRKLPTKQLGAVVLNILWLLSLILHGALLLSPWLASGGIRIDLINSLSIVMWVCGLLLYLAQLNRPLETMGLIVIPLTVTSLLLGVMLPPVGNSINLNSGLGLHILCSLLAYSMLALAALQAVLLATQNRQLHNHKPNGIIRTLPPLQDMEALLFQLILAGVILLTLSLISGSLFLDGLFGRHVAHKTLLSILAWLCFATLLLGHWRYGWRGKIAIRWTIIGFALLMLAFWGSKFVLEYVVNPQ